MNEMPCEGCLCVPMCRHKTYQKLIEDCAVLHDKIMERKHDNEFKTMKIMQWRVEIQDVIKPTNWEVDICGFFTGRIQGSL